MRILLSVVVVAALAVVAFAGEVASWWDLDDAREASKIEIKMGKGGEIIDVEYHVKPDRVPVAVRNAMEAIYNTTSFDAAEKEAEGGERFYELTVTVGNFKHEVMFTPDGQVHSKEIETAPGNPTHPVPPEVEQTIQAKYGSGTVTAWEVIEDGGGNVVEYHVKLTEGQASDQKHYKLIVLPDGFLAGAYLEVVAELEVPMPTR